MKKQKIAVIFGGMSSEHDVSIASGTSVIKNLNQEKYDVLPVYISKEGEWYFVTETIKNLKVGEKLEHIEKIDNLLAFLKNIDVAFPVLHGLYGEDGTIQGMFEMMQIPYVGSKVLGSSISMDKAYTKIIFDRAGIKQANYAYIRKYKDKYIYVEKDFSEKIMTISDIANKIEKEISYPMFVKPSNSGSSVGIQKVRDITELQNAITNASKYDKKILIEEGIEGKEIECSALGNEEVSISCTGEIIPADEFYSYDAKYYNEESKCLIPSSLSKETENKVRKIAKKAYKAVDGKGLARVDFFVKENQEVYINEINTMPGFTEISMYAKLWDASGMPYSTVLEKLIELAQEK